jgi:Sensors of blue-light using FAD
MYQLLYTSKALNPFKDDELQQLLEVARLNNSKKSITGMLLYCNSNFIQLLEGNEQDLAELFEIISADGRHIEVEKIMESKIDHPQFPDWSMGYKFLSAQQLTSLNEHENIDISGFIRKTQPFKLLKLMSAKSWN